MDIFLFFLLRFRPSVRPSHFSRISLVKPVDIFLFFLLRILHTYCYTQILTHFALTGLHFALTGLRSALRGSSVAVIVVTIY